MLRIIGAVLAIAGAVALAVDLVETWRGGARLRATGEWWFRLDRDSLQVAQPAIERHVAPWLWDPVMLTLLETPAALLLLGAGAALWLIGRVLRRDRRAGQ